VMSTAAVGVRTPDSHRLTPVVYIVPVPVRTPARFGGKSRESN